MGSTIEEGEGRWYKYTAVIALTASGTGQTKGTRQIKGTGETEPGTHGIEKTLTEKTLVVRENKPFSMFLDPFFPHYFPASIADELHQIITSRLASGVIPGDAWKKAMFVLPGELGYNPVTVRTALQVPADLSSLEGAAFVARRMERGERLCDRIEQAEGGRTRYKISGADSLQLVTEVIRLYLEEKAVPSYYHAYQVTIMRIRLPSCVSGYHHAYQVLRQAGKISGTADNFRKRYQRACAILRIPFRLETVVEYVRKHL